MPTLISQDDFKGIQNQDLKMNIIFEYIADIYSDIKGVNLECEDRRQECENKFKKLENRKKIDMTISGFFGLIGGYLASVVKSFIQ